MGCVISREAESGIVSEVKEERNSRVESSKKVEEVSTSRVEESVVEVQNGEKVKKVKEKEEKSDGDGVQRPKGERRRSKPNPRLSNPSKHLQGEQVAAGWPSWLTAVCGEALNGWTPRKADTFEKIDKVGLYFLFYNFWTLVYMLDSCGLKLMLCLIDVASCGDNVF
jgi:cyclin-dependent kinase 12/13